MRGMAKMPLRSYAYLKSLRLMLACAMTEVIAQAKSSQARPKGNLHCTLRNQITTGKVEISQQRL